MTPRRRSRKCLHALEPGNPKRLIQQLFGNSLQFSLRFLVSWRVALSLGFTFAATALCCCRPGRQRAFNSRQLTGLWWVVAAPPGYFLLSSFTLPWHCHARKVPASIMDSFSSRQSDFTEHVSRTVLPVHFQRTGESTQKCNWTTQHMLSFIGLELRSTPRGRFVQHLRAPSKDG